MGIIIDHEARRHSIIVKAIQLFAEQGYDGVTYQKIADSCGIARTTLYKYFHNKRQIFTYAIWEASTISNQVFAYILNPKDSVVVRLDRLLEAVLKMLFQRHLMMIVVLDYLLAVQRTGKNLKRNIERHTVTFKRILLRLILEGVRKGELECKDPGAAVELLYTQLESTILRLTISQNANYDEALKRIRQVLELFQKKSLLLLFAFLLSPFAQGGDDVKYQPKSYKASKELKNATYQSKNYESTVQPTRTQPLHESKTFEAKKLASTTAVTSTPLESLTPFQGNTTVEEKQVESKKYVPGETDYPSTIMADPSFAGQEKKSFIAATNASPYIVTERPKTRDPMLEPRQGIKAPEEAPTEKDASK